MVVWTIFYFHPYLGKIPILTNIFQMGWNQQPEDSFKDFKVILADSIQPSSSWIFCFASQFCLKIASSIVCSRRNLATRVFVNKAHGIRCCFDLASSRQKKTNQWINHLIHFIPRISIEVVVFIYIMCFNVYTKAIYFSCFLLWYALNSRSFFDFFFSRFGR